MNDTQLMDFIVKYRVQIADSYHFGDRTPVWHVRWRSQSGERKAADHGDLRIALSQGAEHEMQIAEERRHVQALALHHWAEETR